MTPLEKVNCYGVWYYRFITDTHLAIYWHIYFTLATKNKQDLGRIVAQSSQKFKTGSGYVKNPYFAQLVTILWFYKIGL